MEICIVDNAFFESGHPCVIARDGLAFQTQHRSCKFSLAMGSGNPIVETYRKELIAASQKSSRGLVLRLSKDTASPDHSNNVTLKLDGFLSEESNKSLWYIGNENMKVYVRININMTSSVARGNKIQVLERGSINTGAEMSLSDSQLSGINFSPSILRTRFSNEISGAGGHAYLSGTFAITLIRDCKLQCPVISKKILKDQIHSDVDIICDGGVIKAHKAFLAAQSPVFAAMFKSDMIETRSKTITIDDIAMDALSVVVEFIYEEIIGDPIHENPKLAVEILMASHKYAISELERKMKNLILNKSEDWCDLKSAFQLYMFTRNLECFSDLKIKAVQFMKSKSADITKSDDFINLFKDKNRELGLELFTLGFSLNSRVETMHGTGTKP